MHIVFHAYLRSSTLQYAVNRDEINITIYFWRNSLLFFLLVHERQMKSKGFHIAHANRSSGDYEQIKKAVKKAMVYPEKNYFRTITSCSLAAIVKYKYVCGFILIPPHLRRS